MNCGIYCLKEYLKLYDIEVDLNYEKPVISMLEIVNILKQMQIEASGYYCKHVLHEEPYIIYLPKQKHFMLVKKIGWFVHLCDQRVHSVWLPYFLYLFIYQGYYLKIEKILF